MSNLREIYYKDKSLAVYPFIINTDGIILLHPVKEQGSRSIAGLGPVQEAIRLKNGEINSKIGGRPCWYIYDSFENWNWIIAYVVPLDVKYASANKLRKILIGVMSVIIVTVIIFVSFLLTRFTRPISKLTAVAGEIQRGAFDKQVEVTSQDEVGQLSRAFNDMTRQLKKTMEGLEAEVTIRKQTESE